MYRMLFGLININVQSIEQVTPLIKALESGITSAMVILCISLGVAVPNIFARRYIAQDRRKFLEQELKKRKERGKFIEW